MDWAGFDDGTRGIPAVLQQTIDANPGVAIRAESGIAESTLRDIGAALVNSELRVVQEVSTPVNHGFNLAGGTRFDMDSGMSIGLIMNAGSHVISSIKRVVKVMRRLVRTVALKFEMKNFPLKV